MKDIFKGVIAAFTIACMLILSIPYAVYKSIRNVLDDYVLSYVFDKKSFYLMKLGRLSLNRTLFDISVDVYMHVVTELMPHIDINKAKLDETMADCRHELDLEIDIYTQMINEL